MTPRTLAEASADILERVRDRAPRIHAITNSAATVLTANLLLAAGATPSLTVSAEEVGDFVASADALLVNLGTFDPDRREAALAALDVVDEERLAWVLDPVLCDRSAGRAAFARELAAREPDAVRANAAEMAALTGTEPDPAALDRFALENLCVVAVTGETDLVADGARRASIGNGHALMARTTAAGCAGGALIAACLAVEDDTFLATAAALLALGVAGEMAAVRAHGPGTFPAAWIDAIAALDGPALVARARVAGPYDAS